MADCVIRLGKHHETRLTGGLIINFGGSPKYFREIFCVPLSNVRVVNYDKWAVFPRPEIAGRPSRLAVSLGMIVLVLGMFGAMAFHSAMPLAYLVPALFCTLVLLPRSFLCIVRRPTTVIHIPSEFGTWRLTFTRDPQKHPDHVAFVAALEVRLDRTPDTDTPFVVCRFAAPPRSSTAYFNLAQVIPAGMVLWFALQSGVGWHIVWPLLIVVAGMTVVTQVIRTRKLVPKPLQLARSYLLEDDVDGAMQILDAYLIEKPDDPECLFLLHAASLRALDFERAAAALEALEHADPKAPKRYNIKHTPEDLRECKRLAMLPL